MQVRAFEIYIPLSQCHLKVERISFPDFVSPFIISKRLARREAGLSPPVKYCTDRSKAVLLLLIFMGVFCLAFAMPLCASVYICLVVTCWERADL